MKVYAAKFKMYCEIVTIIFYNCIYFLYIFIYFYWWCGTESLGICSSP
jgi:hypothetical protein